MPIQAPTEDDLKRKTLDDGVSSYLDKTAENLGKPSYTTEAGSLYADRVTNGLKTPDASSVNAQQTEDTNAARRAYLSKVEADERVGQSGFALGSAQATRIADQSQAGVNQANQAGQSAVNAYIRQRTEDNMSRARGLEEDQQRQNQINLQNVQGQSNTLYNRGQDTLNRAERADETTYRRGRDTVADTRYADETAYNRGRDTVADTRYADETGYNRTQDALNRAERAAQVVKNDAQQAFENQQVLKGNDEAAKRDLINSLPDGPAKNAVVAGLANGSLTIQNALQQVMNPDGSIKEEYRGKTPGELGQDAEKEYAIQTLEMEAQANGTAFDPNSPEGIRAIAAKMLATRTAKDTPVNDQTEARDLEAAKKRIASLPDGQVPEQEDLDLLPSINIQAIPVKPKDLNPWLAANDTGGWVKIGGTPYEVIRGGNEIGGEEGDFVEIRDAEGGTHYITKGGVMTDTKPSKPAYEAYINNRSWGR